MKKRIKNKKLKQAMKKAVKELINNDDNIVMLKQWNGKILKLKLAYVECSGSRGEYQEITIHGYYKA